MNSTSYNPLAVFLLALHLLMTPAHAQSPSPTASATPVSIELPAAPESAFEKVEAKCFASPFTGAVNHYNSGNYEKVSAALEERRATLQNRKRFDRETPEDSLLLQSLVDLRQMDEEAARRHIAESLSYRRARADALLVLAHISPPTVARELLREAIFFGRGCLVPPEVLRYERARSLLINALPPQVADADNELTEALKLNANYASAVFAQGEISLVKKQRDSAISQFQRAASLPGAPTLANLRAIDAILFQAHRVFNREQLQSAFQSAQTELKKAEAGSPLEREALIRVIRSAIEVGETSSAKSAFKRLSSLLPADDLTLQALSDQLKLEAKMKGIDAEDSPSPSPSASS